MAKPATQDVDAKNRGSYEKRNGIRRPITCQGQNQQGQINRNSITSKGEDHEKGGADKSRSTPTRKLKPIINSNLPTHQQQPKASHYLQAQKYPTKKLQCKPHHQTTQQNDTTISSQQPPQIILLNGIPDNLKGRRQG